ncbi:cellulose synthase-like protein E6 [Magnolia sinica]|uniref:cellulose synthase-like protein E6 n=1 Tax=Magnolia sinica TaxID=86752 RepID=UPI0026581983|nr:cellulose synthase-like protein E6 [Magnolia sinica]
MAYDYPPEILSIYLSDDGGSDLTFYALLEASRFSKHWIPFCKKFKVDPRSPAVYFGTTSEPHDTEHGNEWLSTKKLHEEMANLIDTAVKLGLIPSEIRAEHKGFAEWHSVVNSGIHHTILQILIDGRDPNAVDIEGSALPTLVYMAREKRPQHPHNFKAGALNALVIFTCLYVETRATGRVKGQREQDPINSWAGSRDGPSPFSSWTFGTSPSS